MSVDAVLQSERCYKIIIIIIIKKKVLMYRTLQTPNVGSQSKRYTMLHNPYRGLLNCKINAFMNAMDASRILESS